MLCFRKFPVAKNFMDNRGGGGGIKIFLRKTFVSQCRTLSQLSPFVLCLRKLPVAKKVIDKSGYQDFPSENFCLTVQGKICRGTLLCCV